MIPLPIVIHVYGEVREGVFRCGCDSEFRVWRDMAGRVHEGGREQRACPVRPYMRWAIERDADGLPKAMHWQGYW
jgi:hypothetical protein